MGRCNFSSGGSGPSTPADMSVFILPQQMVLSAGGPVLALNSAFGTGGFEKRISTYALAPGDGVATCFAPGHTFDSTKPIKITICWTPSSNDLLYTKTFQSRIWIVGNDELVNVSGGPFTPVLSPVTINGFNAFYQSITTIIPPTHAAGLVKPSDLWWIEIQNVPQTEEPHNTAVVEGILLEYSTL